MGNTPSTRTDSAVIYPSQGSKRNGNVATNRPTISAARKLNHKPGVPRNDYLHERTYPKKPAVPPTKDPVVVFPPTEKFHIENLPSSTTTTTATTQPSFDAMPIGYSRTYRLEDLSTRPRRGSSSEATSLQSRSVSSSRITDTTATTGTTWSSAGGGGGRSKPPTRGPSRTHQPKQPSQSTSSSAFTAFAIPPPTPPPDERPARPLRSSSEGRRPPTARPPVRVERSKSFDISPQIDPAYLPPVAPSSYESHTLGRPSIADDSWKRSHPFYRSASASSKAPPAPPVVAPQGTPAVTPTIDPGIYLPPHPHAPPHAPSTMQPLIRTTTTKSTIKKSHPWYHKTSFSKPKNDFDSDYVHIAPPGLADPIVVTPSITPKPDPAVRPKPPTSGPKKILRSLSWGSRSKPPLVSITPSSPENAPASATMLPMVFADDPEPTINPSLWSHGRRPSLPHNTSNSGGVRFPLPDSPVIASTVPSTPSTTSTIPPILFCAPHDPFYSFTTFSPHKILYKKKLYPTAEHLFQAFKFFKTNPMLAEHLRICTQQPLEVYIEAQRFKSQEREDFWKVKVSFMDEILYHKFTQHRDLREELFQTYPAELIGNSPKDSFWGVGADGNGSNELGKALVRLRTRLRAEAGL